jgi:hypothetical protein
MKQFNSLTIFLGIILIIGFTGCNNTVPTEVLINVPVFNLSDLDGAKSLTAKSVVFTDETDMIMKLTSPMVVGFEELNVEEDQTDISMAIGDSVETFSMTKTSSGITFELNVPEGNITVDVNEASDTFTLVEDFVVDYDLVVSGSDWEGSMYRFFESTEFTGIDTFHEEFVIKTYDATHDGGGPPTYTPEYIVAVKGEVFKTSTISGVLIKSKVIKYYSPDGPSTLESGTPANPHDMTPSQKAAEIAKLGTPALPNGTTDSDGTIYKEYFLWIYEVGVGYQYAFSSATTDGWFKDTDGDGDYHNDPAGDNDPDGPDDIDGNADDIDDGDTLDDEELVSVLASYGWTMLP